MSSDPFGTYAICGKDNQIVILENGQYLWFDSLDAAEQYHRENFYPAVDTYVVKLFTTVYVSPLD